MNQPSFFESAGDGPVRVKICGLTRREDAEMAIELGAGAIGINFWPKSKRYIPFEQAEPWLTDLPPVASRVGVFVNASLDEILRILDSGAIDAAQLHGDESPDLVGEILDRGYFAFKALGIRDRESLERVSEFPGDAILLDAYAPSLYGGSGETMDWVLGRKAVEKWPGRRIILAGGLTPENVAAAVQQVRPHAVDVASGVESSPGLKDREKTAALIRNCAAQGKS